MTNEPDPRIDVASRLREFGNEFVDHEFTAEEFQEIRGRVEELLEMARRSPSRIREIPSGGLESFKMTIPERSLGLRRHLASDQIVSGGGNPMGLGGFLSSEGSVAVMDVTLGKAFEGPPGHAHGGAVAALIDETMGLAVAINNVPAFTVQLSVSYVGPTPINEPIVARAWIENVDGRKNSVEATVTAGETIVATGSALFIRMNKDVAP